MTEVLCVNGTGIEVGIHDYGMTIVALCKYQLVFFIF